MSFLVPQTAQHTDHLGSMDSEIFQLRVTLLHMEEWVEYLEEERYVADIRILLVQDQLHDAHDETQFHRQLLEEVVSHTESLKQ